ncbi:response regulator transcription factor [Paenibacillus thalictri]|uniref:Response regulator n=1 Tax=Paenibacillus thalictri TaxID=2527873 RepID=A0A4Q9DJW1_9BACL|nr:helix-turn-helix domain-containing protein [Paenibacillus thalictri]TBL74644.1 response regulator [Paenibacillus thalictri]
MYKLILVDDDRPVLAYLTKSIPWSDLGIQLTGTFDNGLIALEVAKNDVPDIIITDIGMPKMNGLELIDAIRSFNPGLLSILISCHDKFEYAQQAIRLNVTEYMLKDALVPEVLIQHLKKLVHILDANAASRQKTDKEHFLGKTPLSILKNRWIRTTVHDPIFNYEEWIREAEKCGLTATYTTYVPVLCYLNYGEEIKKRFHMSEDLLNFTLENAISEILRANESGIYFGYDCMRNLIIFPYSGSSKSELWSYVRNELARIQRELKRYLSIKLSFIIGNESTFTSRLADHIQMLFRSNEQYFYMEPESVAELSMPQQTKEDLFSYYYNTMEALQEAASKGDLALIQQLTKQRMRFIRDKKFPSGAVKEWISKVAIGLRMKIRSLYPLTRNLEKDDFRMDMNHYYSLSEIEEHVTAIIDSLIDDCTSITSHKTKRNEIVMVQRYLVSHINELVTLEEVSDLLKLNSSYVSRLFKRETGLNFSKYVTKVKVEHAKELLEHTSLSVDVISERIGYEKNYFYKIFKKWTGMTPNSFRGYR